VVTAVFFLIAVRRFLTGRAGTRDRIMLVATTIASVLSGSRTIIAGMALGLVLLAIRSGLRPRLVRALVVAGLSMLAVLHFSPALSDRLLGTTAEDPALAVRSVVWSDVLDKTDPGELAVGGSAWVDSDPPVGKAEGALGAVQQVGFVGMALFAAAVLSATGDRALRVWWVLLVPVAVSLAVDSAYLVFPTLFIPLARMFAPLDDVGQDAAAVPVELTE
jgi:hypothetical protein